MKKLIFILLLIVGCEEPKDVYGCIDNTACNYDANATIDNSSCTYGEENYDCAGNCDEGYSEIDSICYYQSDLDVLQTFIDNSGESINMYMDKDSSGTIEPLELKDQFWKNGRLTELNCGDLSGEYICGLSGTIPSTIGNLIYLEKLWLDHNNLSGEIPNTIGNLINLYTLRLNVNQLSGEIPDDIGNLINLKFLWLASNDLTGQIPEQIGNLNNLTWLGLRSNQLTSLPQSIGNLFNLQYLNISYNQIEGSIPNSFGNLINVELVYMDNNQLSGVIPDSIGNLENVVILHLNNNQLSDLIPNSICSLTINWDWIHYDESYFRVDSNQLCPPYPECIEDYVGEQDTSECEYCIENPTDPLCN